MGRDNGGRLYFPVHGVLESGMSYSRVSQAYRYCEGVQVKTATFPKRRQPKRRQIQNGNKPKRRHTKTVRVAVLDLSPFWLTPKRRHVKTATVQIDLSPNRFQNAVLTCIRNGDTPKRRHCQNLIANLIAKIITFKRNNIIYNSKQN